MRALNAGILCHEILVIRFYANNNNSYINIRSKWDYKNLFFVQCNSRFNLILGFPGNLFKNSNLISLIQ